jgi:hypothetical protein
MPILTHQPVSSDRPGLRIAPVERARPASDDATTRKPGVSSVILLYILAAATIEGVLLFLVLR